MEREIRKESHSLKIEELDNFIKVTVFLPVDLFYKIAVSAENYSNRIEYERQEISKFRNKIFDDQLEGVSLFSNEAQYKFFLKLYSLKNHSTDEWFKVVFIDIGSHWRLKTRSMALGYIAAQSTNFQNKYTLRRRIEVCETLVRKDPDFKICRYNPNSAVYMDWAVDIVDLDEYRYYVKMRYVPRNMTTISFYEAYKNQLKKTELVERNERYIMSIQKEHLNEALAAIKDVIKIDLNTLKVGEKSYWNARSFED